MRHAMVCLLFRSLFLLLTRGMAIAGTLRVHYIRPPLPRSILGKLHIVFAILRQIHLTLVLLFFSAPAPEYDVYLVDQLSTCIPLIRWQTRKSVVFYCHFPDKLLADGKVAPVGAKAGQAKGRSLLKRLYRLPVDWLEEATTGAHYLTFGRLQSFIRLINRTSRYHSRQLRVHFWSFQKFIPFDPSRSSGSLPRN
jgi:hypothetical protein